MALTANQMTTGEVRLSYVHLSEPYSNNGGEPKYSVTVLMPKSDTAAKARFDAAQQYAVQEGVAKKWNGVMPPVIAFSIHDGDGVRPNGEAFGAECRGHWVFTASSKNPVPLVDENMNPIVQKTDIYSGCYGRVCISLFAYNNAGKRGIGIGLEAVQKLRDGDALGGSVSVSDAFGMGAPAVNIGAPAAPMYQQPVQYQQPAPVQYPGYPAPGAVDPITGQAL